MALIATGNWTQLHAVPFWVKVACAVAIALGTYLGGWRIIRTLGKGLVEINSPQGMAADASSAAVILASSHMGFALSTTHVATGSILGSGLGRSGAKVNWRVAGRMLMSWAITLPAAALAGAVMWLVGHLLGGLFGALAIFVILLAAASLMYLHSRKSTIDHSNVNDEWVENVTAPRPLAATTEVADLIELEQPRQSRMKILWLAFEGTWHVLLAGLILGAGLPTLFALGVRSLSMGTRGDPARRPSLLGKVIAGLCFAVVLLAVLAGIATIVAHGLGVQLSFDGIIPVFTSR